MVTSVINVKINHTSMTVDVERSNNKTARYQNLTSWLTDINKHTVLNISVAKAYAIAVILDMWKRTWCWYVRFDKKIHTKCGVTGLSQINPDMLWHVRVSVYFIKLQSLILKIYLLCFDFPVASSYIPYCTALRIIYDYSYHCSPRDMFIYSTELITSWY
jgi:hypothetical protein